MHCGRVSNLLSAYIDRELSGAEMLQIRRHLNGCAACSAEHEALGSVKSLLAAAPAMEPSDGMVEAVMRRWAEWDEPAPTQRRTEAPAVPRFRWGWPSGPRWHRYSLALTSACLVLALAGTAVALRTPKYPDAVAAITWPRLSQPEERLPRHGPSAFPVDGVARQRPESWWSAAEGGVSPLLVSDTPFSAWGR